MATLTENLPNIARQQEQQKLTKVLAGGIGCSLLFHGFAAIAYNYLPKQATAPTEVTFVNTDEIPKDLLPSPSPTPTITAQVKPSIISSPKPTPTVKVQPIPTPLVTPTPTPTPVVKKTPLSKSSPSPTPPEVKIVTNPVQPVLPIPESVSPVEPLADTPLSSSKVKPPSDVESSDQQIAKRQAEPKQNEQSGRKNPSDANTDALSGEQNKFTKTVKDLSENLNQGGTSGSKQESFGIGGGIFNGNNGSLAKGGNGNPIFDTGSIAGDGGNSGSGESFSSDISPRGGNAGGGGFNKGGNHSGSLARGGNGNLSFDSGFGTGDMDNSGDGVTYLPGVSGRSNSSLGNTGGGGNGSALTARGNKPGWGNGNGGSGDTGTGIGGDSFTDTSNPTGGGGRSRSGLGNSGGGGNGSALTARNNKPGGLGGSSGSPGAGDSGVTRGGFGSGLECLANCNPQYPDSIEREATVKVAITLDDNGRVIKSELRKSSQDRKLDNFTEVEFRKVQFRIPDNFRQRKFVVYMKFTETR